MDSVAASDAASWWDDLSTHCITKSVLPPSNSVAIIGEYDIIHKAVST